MEPNIGIKDAGRKAVVDILNGVLADATLLYIKTRNYHWHVAGPHFAELHEFFQEQYTQLEAAIDEVAERVVIVGGRAHGTLVEFAKAARLKEEPGKIPDAMGMVANLLADHEAVIRQLRKDVDACAEKHGDMGTSDFLTGLMEAHEKMAWMLRAHLTE